MADADRCVVGKLFVMTQSHSQELRRAIGTPGRRASRCHMARYGHLTTRLFRPPQCGENQAT